MMTNLRFTWEWVPDARNWLLSPIDMGDGLVAGYDHMAGYYERQLIEEIERLRGQSTADYAVVTEHVHAFDEKFGICQCGAWQDHFNCPKCQYKSLPNFKDEEQCPGCGLPFELKDVLR